MPVQTVKQLFVSRRSRPALIDDNNIEPCKRCLVLPKRLPHDAFDSIAAIRLSAVLFRDCKTKPGVAAVFVSAKNGKPFVLTACCFFEDTSKRRRTQEPIVFSEPVRRAADRCLLFVCRRDGRQYE